MERSDSTVQQIASLKPCKTKSGIGKLSVYGEECKTPSSICEV